MSLPSKQQRNSFTLLRALENDAYEVIDYRGFSHFLRLLPCIECETLRAPEEFKDSRACGRCVAREHKRWSLESKEKIGRENRARNIAGGGAKKRWARFVMASPAWRDREKIKAIYADAKKLSAETGIEHEVDHYYPIQGQLCSGLHVHENLGIIPTTENRRKHASHPLGESPATTSFIEEHGESALMDWIRKSLKEIERHVPLTSPMLRGTTVVRPRVPSGLLSEPGR